MAQELATEYRTTRFALFLTIAFATGAVVLAAVGLFALLTNTVTRQIPEFAIRLAVGASPATVRRGVLRTGLRLVLLGSLMGAVGATLSGRAVRLLLYATVPTDLVAAASTAGVMLLVGFLACWFPARRASSIAPMEVLRRE